jgi:hypothetical protein
MARGWESKAIESQIEAARSESASSSKRTLSPEEASTQRNKETLLLARARLVQQLQAARNPRHREMMEKALADLDKTLATYKRSRA